MVGYTRSKERPNRQRIDFGVSEGIETSLPSTVPEEDLERDYVV